MIPSHINSIALALALAFSALFSLSNAAPDSPIAQLCAGATGSMVCLSNGLQYVICNGPYSFPQNVAVGTLCVQGQIVPAALVESEFAALSQSAAAASQSQQQQQQAATPSSASSPSPTPASTPASSTSSSSSSSSISYKFHTFTDAPYTLALLSTIHGKTITWSLEVASWPTYARGSQAKAVASSTSKSKHK